MKYFFVLNHALYLRNYGSVLVALAEQDNEIEIAFTASRQGDDAVFRRLFADHSNIRLVEGPARTGWWWAAADPLRAIRDYIHYQQAAFDGAPRLVERASSRVPKLLRRLVGRRGHNRRRRQLVDSAVASVERAIPADSGVAEWISRHSPDAIFLSPLIELGYEQLHILKAAKSLAVPAGHLVASWDNLSNKGRIQIHSDLCLVWNDFQKQEAIDLHAFPAEKIVVTGAQLYDHWFEMKPLEDRDSYCRGLGLDAARPLILYACSSPFICPDEVAFVRRWLTALRASSDPEVGSAQIVVRPHPAHALQWHSIDLSSLGPVVVSPSAGAAPIEHNERQVFFDALSHAAAVVGINTSVFLEAGIVGRRCLTVRSPEFEASQSGTLHFHYLVNGGLLEMAGDMAKHLEALGSALRGEPRAASAEAFIEAFLRPHGIETPAVPIAKAAIEQLSKTKVNAERPTAIAPLIRAFLFPIAALFLRPRYLARRARRPADVREGIQSAAASSTNRGDV